MWTLDLEKVETPWGVSYTPETIATGIISHSTASHGGIELSPDREAEVQKKFPGFMPFCGRRGWYEEDCDWALVAITFPQHFTEENLANAKRIVESYQGYFNHRRA
jgi:hypothetical protein